MSRESIEYIVTPAVIVVGIGGYMGSIVNDLFGWDVAQPIWWLIFYAIFVGLNVIGVAATFRFSVFICIAALAILAVFWIGALTKLDFQTYAIDAGGGWFPDGISGIFYAHSVRDLVLPRDRGAAACGGGVTRPQARHPTRHDLWPVHA